MKRFTFGLVLAALLALMPSLGAQQAITQTTTAAAVAAPSQGSPANVIALASATGISGPSATFQGTECMIEQEAILVTAVSGSNVTAIRGYSNSNAVAHASGAIVLCGPSQQSLFGSPFVRTDPPLGSACTLGNESWTARINEATGVVSTCQSNGWARRFNGNLMAAFMGFLSGQTAGTTVTTLLPMQAGTTVFFDAASGNNFKLPTPVAGMTFDFLQTATVTSNNAEVQTSGAAVFIQGTIHIAISGGATGSDWACNGTSHIALKMNGTTTGGILGGRLHFVAVSSTLWQVDGLLQGSGTEATPCSTTT